MSKEFAIKICLQRIKNACSCGEVDFVRRQKNLQTLFDLNLTVNDVIGSLLNLSVSDYVSGPEKDRDGTPGQIWKFRHPISNYMIYVKLKFFELQTKDRLKIISFHTEE
jgi:hypothetical protein